MLRPVYVIAVSGGVDSVVLLDKIASRLEKSRKEKPTDDFRPPLYIVAHVDHGIRKDSGRDALFVKKLAKKYSLPYECERLNLSQNSEEEARNKRYEFLFRVMKKYKADAVLTAHHEDDVIETMIMNLLRGTGPRGLIGFSQKGILRPLLNKTKKDLIQYAKKNKLEWREDSTNNDSNYLRNDIRARIMPKIKNRKKWLELRERVEKTYGELDDLTKKLLVQSLKRGELSRANFVILPYIVQKELMATWLRLEGIEINKPMVEKAVLTAKTLLVGKHVELTKNAKLFSEAKTLVLKVEGRAI